MMAPFLVDLSRYIGLPGGPVDEEDANFLAEREAESLEFDWFGAREDDGRVPADVNPDCVCGYCRFYRKEGGIRYVMCAQQWNLLPNEVKVNIAESCAD